MTTVLTWWNHSSWKLYKNGEPREYILWTVAMTQPFLSNLISLEAMGCCGINGDAKEEAEEEKRAKKTNKDIERQIQKDKQVKVKLRLLNTINFEFKLIKPNNLHHDSLLISNHFTLK